MSKKIVDEWDSEVVAELLRELSYAKEEERRGQEKRRALEDRLLTFLSYKESTSKKNYSNNGIAFAITGRCNTTVDSKLLNRVIQEEGLQDWGQRLFRWKPEKNAGLWLIAPEDVRKKLSVAIKESYGRPSISIDTDMAE